MIAPVFNAGGTAVFKLAFTDENGDPVIPNEAQWWITRRGKAIGEADNISQLDSVVEIVLSGDDLVVGRAQALCVAGTYNSNLGTDLPFREFQLFDVQRLPCATPETPE